MSTAHLRVPVLNPLEMEVSANSCTKSGRRKGKGDELFCYFEPGKARNTSAGCVVDLSQVDSDRTLVRSSDWVIWIWVVLSTSVDVLVESTNTGTSWNADDSACAAEVGVASNISAVYVLDWVVGSSISNTVSETLIGAVDRDALEDGVTRDDWEHCGGSSKELHGGESGWIVMRKRKRLSTQNQK